MFLTFLSTPLVKNLIGLLALVALVFGIFMWGRSTGVSAGFDDGVKSQAATIATQKATIANLTKQINDQRVAEATKVQDVQKTTADEVVHAAQQNTVQVVTRTKIVDHYIQVETPAAASQCAVDLPTVMAINSLLDTQASYDNMDVPTVAPDVTPPQEVPK